MSNIFPINTSPTKRLLVSNITKDASNQACIFDIIDNSIDAARNCIISGRKKALSNTRLPESYKGYQVGIFLNGDCVSIEDNCGGMDINSLSSGILRFGQASAHEFGIGHYGVGLNRAIFKLGNNTLLKTESKTGRAIVEIDRTAYLEDDDSWDITGTRIKKTGKIGTVVTITNLDESVSRSTSDRLWVDNLTDQISVRYARFLKKGLSISTNNTPISPDLVLIRTDGPFPPLTKSFKISNGVSVRIEAGQHSLHRFTIEPDYNRSSNDSISEQFGWSIVCNDRVIVHLDTGQKTGWAKKWHGEFNGFVGYVYFTSREPGELPWNTSKTDVDQNHELYQSVIADMQSFVETWRNFATDVKKLRLAGGVLLPQPSISPKTPPKSRSKTKAATPVIKENQTANPFLLPSDINEQHCSDKLLQLVKEAKELNFYRTRYSCLALTRMLFEVSCRIFLQRNGLFANCALRVIAQRDSDRQKDGKPPLTKKERDTIDFNIDELCWLFKTDSTLWIGGNPKGLEQCLDQFSSHRKRLNSAIHQPFQGINVLEALKIRDECLPLLRFFIEN